MNIADVIERRKIFLGCIACVLILIAPIIGAVHHKRAQVLKRQSVAIIGFRSLNPGSQKAWIASAMAEMIASDLSRVTPVAVITNANVERMRQDLNFPIPKNISQGNLSNACHYLHCTMAVEGSYLIEEHRVWMDLRLNEINSGKVLATVTVSGSDNNLQQLAAEGSERLRVVLGILQ